MNHYCAELQERLAEKGVLGLRGDNFATQHLGECRECFGCLDALERLDNLFEQLPAESVEQELIDKTLEAVRGTPFEDQLVPAWSLILQGLIQMFSPLWRAVSEVIGRFIQARRSLTPWPRMQLSAVGGALAAVVALLLVVQNNDSAVRNAKPSVSIREGGAAEAYGDLVVGFRSDLDSTKDGLQDARNDIQNTKGEFKEHKDRVTGLFETMVDNYEQLAREIDSLAAATRQTQETVPLPSSPELQGPDQLEVMGFDETMAVPPPVETGDRSGMTDMRPTAVLPLAGLNSTPGQLPSLLRRRKFEHKKDSGVFYKETGKPNPEMSGVDEKSVFQNLKQQFAANLVKSKTVGKTNAGSGKGRELAVYLTPGEPTELIFPGKIVGGFKRKHSSLNLDRDGCRLVVFAQPDIPYQGEALLVMVDDQQSFAIRFIPSDDDNPREPIIKIDRQASFDYSQTLAPHELVYPEYAEEKLEGGAEESVGISLPLEWDNSVDPLEWFWESRALVDELDFKEPRGYWSNTYVSGSPTLRDLHTSLLAWDRVPLEKQFGKAMQLHDGSSPVTQPFDAPRNAALAVYTHADRQGLRGKGRVLVQVGLKGAERHGGRRPAMNVGVVLDFRGHVSPSTLVMLRAILFSLNELKDIGDRFSLTVAGSNGGLLIPAKDFRHGFLSITWDELSNGRYSKGTPLGLLNALETAIAHVSEADNPNAPLGSSVVLLLSDKNLSNELDPLKLLAAKSAVGGVPLSVVGIGNQADGSALEALARSGQGNRWSLGQAADAKQLIEKELAAVSRVVARAVRLNIRLAPEVKLVDVIGSKRLEDEDGKQVRQAESSIDLRLARNLGIEADRGEDEDGIQIFIPSYYAGDAHVILLDIVAPGPGPILEVTARYKDLTQLKNATSRAQLALASRFSPPGRLEENVVKNLLSLQLGSLLEYAGRKVNSQQERNAADILMSYRQLLDAFQNSSASLARDPDLQADVIMLDDYLALLLSVDETLKVSREHLAGSLELAGKRKVIPFTATPLLDEN